MSRRADDFRNIIAAHKQQTTPVETPVATPVETAAATPVLTAVPTPAATGVGREPYLDATHTPSEKSIYSVMYRETVSKGVTERHFGFKELSGKSGIRSDATIRRALDGLLAKQSIEIVAYFHGSPLGPRYRVYDPKEILRRRKAVGIEIDPQSKRITTGVATPVETPVTTGVPTPPKTDGRTPVAATPVTPATSTGVINKNESDQIIKELRTDDDAFAGLVKELAEASREVTGREVSPKEAERWADFGRLLAGLLRAAAQRAVDGVNSPAGLLASDVMRHYARAKPEKRATGPVTAQPEPFDIESDPGLVQLRDELAKEFPHLKEQP